MIIGIAGLMLGSIMIFVQIISASSQKIKNSDFTSPGIGNVLYISSYDYQYDVTESQLEGLERAFIENNITYEIFFMDMKNYDTEENFVNFYNSVKYKLSSLKTPFNAVVVSDDAALLFVKKYQNELFPKTPIVFFGINNIQNSQETSSNPWITGFAETLFIKETLEIAIEQNPDVECIVSIIDDSISGIGDQKQLGEAIKHYPNLDYKFINLSKLTVTELALELLLLPENSVAICLSYLQDYAHKNGFTSYELVNFIQTYANKTPVYRTNSIGMGAGFVGGVLYDFEDVSYKAGLTVAQIINGKDVSEIPLNLDPKGTYIFDWKALTKLRLNEKALPDKTIFINKPLSFFDKNRSTIVPFAFICLSLVLLLSVSFAGYRKTKNINNLIMVMNRKIRQTNKELVASKQKLTFIANNDKLTKLPNRDFGETEIRRIIKTGVPFTLFLMDVDDFKNYNDTYTHSCGDFVLQEYGKRLASLTLSNEYFAARYGGDEFLLVHKCGHIDKNGGELEKIKNILNEPIEFNNMNVDLTATLGYVNSSPELTYDDLIVNADIAMYEGKKLGKKSIVGFSPDMRESIIRKNKIVEILKKECSQDGFEVRYQPQISVETGDIYGFEALVRLQNYSIGPGEFIPIAEKAGFIAQIGRIVTEKVILDMVNWRNEGMKLKKVAINYSNGQLLDEEYIPFLKKLLDENDISPNLIEIEITESLFIGNVEKAKMFFEELEKIGVTIALDDFGTGFSSLSYLTFLPAKKVKIDKSLIDNYLADEKENFIGNIVHLVHDLGMKLTVEGVEQKWQYDKLAQMKCDFIQGYFFSKPMLSELIPDFTVAL